MRVWRSARFHRCRCRGCPTSRPAGRASPELLAESAAYSSANGVTRGTSPGSATRQPRGAGQHLPPCRIGQDPRDLTAANLPDPVDEALHRSVPITVITRSPDAKRRNAPDTTPTIASSSSSSTSWEPLSQASQPQSGIQVITTAGSPTPRVTPASSTGPRWLRAGPVGAHRRRAARGDQRGTPRCGAVPPSGSARCAPPPRAPAASRATTQASARAPTIRHLAGSDSREYSSSRGLRSGCGSGQRREPTAGDRERLVDGVQQLLLGDHRSP